jgi:dTDP-glucose 4,6-dehydratase
MITCALNGKPLPVYGKGENIRDWIYVEDHCRGIEFALKKGKIGQTYCLGGNCELQNIEIVKRICDLLDELKPKEDGHSYKDQISFVQDRPGHDVRYAVDDAKAKRELGYKTQATFDENFRKTVCWFLEN